MEEIIKETEDNEEKDGEKDACENCNGVVDTTSSEYFDFILKLYR